MNRLSHPVGRLLIALGVVLLVLILFPAIVLADNCASTTDCWATSLGGVLAAVGLGWFAVHHGLPLPNPNMPQDAYEADRQRQAQQDGLQSDQNHLQNLIQGVNPGRGGLNCALTSAAVENRFRGVSEVAPVITDPSGREVNPGLSVSQIADLNGGSFHDEPSIDQIGNELLYMGDGSRGIVRIDWGNGSAHAFNAVNMEGTVYYVDGQNGSVTSDSSKWQNPNFSIKFLPTYPP